MRRTTLGTASRMRRFRALLPLPTTKEYIPLFVTGRGLDPQDLTQRGLAE